MSPSNNIWNDRPRWQARLVANFDHQSVLRERLHRLNHGPSCLERLACKACTPLNRDLILKNTFQNARCVSKFEAFEDQAHAELLLELLAVRQAIPSALRFPDTPWIRRETGVAP
jgi:hypothetical protein